MSSSTNSPDNSPTSQASSKPVYYLDPLRVSTDVKQSPLALLAETCNNIGKDILPLKKSLNNNNHSLSDRKRTQNSPNVNTTPHKKNSSAIVTPESKSHNSYSSARSSPRAVCPDTSQLSPVNASPNPSNRSRSRSPIARKTSNTTISNQKSPENASIENNNRSTSPQHKSPSSNFLMNNVLGYNSYASLGLSWPAALMATHSPNTPCMDPYCPHCHVTHRPCACLQCLQQKLLSDPYAAYLASLQQLTSATLSPPTSTMNTPSSGCVTAEYCIYCGKHCPSPDDLISHMQMHLTKKDTAAPQPNANANPNPTNMSMYNPAALDLAKSLMSPSRPFPPFRPPMPSRLAAHLANYPFGAGLV